MTRGNPARNRMAFRKPLLVIILVANLLIVARIFPSGWPLARHDT